MFSQYLALLSGLRDKDTSVCSFANSDENIVEGCTRIKKLSGKERILRDARIVYLLLQ